MSGKVYLIGAGPGDPELLTLKGKRCLEQAEVVIYDYLSNPTLLQYAKADAELIAADFRGKRFSDGSIMNQALINKLIVDRAKRGKIVVRLKGGDPFIFGRGGEEAEILADHKIVFEVVPGITAASGSAYAGFPLTHRKFSSSVSFITGHEDPNKAGSSVDWDCVAKTGTLVFYMGIENLPKIVARLINAGRSRATPAALIEWVTRGAQRGIYGNLANIVTKVKAARVRAPALIVVGEIISLHNKLNWRKRLPLSGQTILVTRSRDQASKLSEKLNLLGAETIEFPTIEIVPPRSFVPLDRAIAGLRKYNYLIFTSVNGVDYFFKRLILKGRDSRLLAAIKIAAIGPGTAAELLAFGIKPDFQANCDYSQEGLLKELLKEELEGQNILIPRAAKAREVLARRLRRAGAKVSIVPAYRTVKPKIKFNPFAQKIDVITFTSSSTVSNFVSIFGVKKARRLLQDVKIVSIGKITTATAKKFDLKVTAQAKRSTIDGLVEAVL
ncbi:uroporphyrinogen-III C-methyltransferase [Candidatus Saganbacteria bacterium]|nr:uroporphyrinogen-III C-methyltransferase [Candidatus Saganbacteria bacterium]